MLDNNRNTNYLSELDEREVQDEDEEDEKEEEGTISPVNQSD